MARHRDFRTFNRDEHDFDDDDDYHGYGQSYDDDQFGASPTTRQQYTYNYAGRHVISDLFPVDKDYVIDEQDFVDNQPSVEQVKLDKQDGRKNINPEPGGKASNAKNTSHNVSIPISVGNVGSSTVMNAPKPQRQPRAGRRSRVAGDNTHVKAVPEQPTVDIVDCADVGNTSAMDSLNFQFDDLSIDSKVEVRDDSNINQSARLQPTVCDGSRRQSSPVIRARQAAGDSIRTPKATRVAQLAVREAGSPGIQASTNRNSSTKSTSTPNNRSGQSPGRTPKDVAKRREAEKAKITAAYKKRQSSKPIINLVVVGHVDAGKSTLMGHVLHIIEPSCETRSGRPLSTESRGVASSDEDRAIPFSWNLDETDTERDRGVTIDVAQTCFETDHRRVVLLDAPGHKDFIPNMISGAAQADVALLVVNGTRGEFETGFDSGGQTREHAMLVRSLGVHQLIVAVNKMDTVDWSKERYDSVIKKSRPFLKNVRFNNVQFVPVSGLFGINLLPHSSSSSVSLQIPPIPEALSSWYSGPSLLEVIDQLEIPERQIDKPFRFCVSDFFRIPNSPGVTVSGMVVSGAVLNSSRVLCKPAGFSATVKSISIAAAGQNSTSEAAFAGDLCTLLLTGANVDMSLIASGNVVCDADSPVIATNKFEARILLLTKEASIARGAALMFHLQNISETAIMLRLHRIVDRASGEVKTRNPRVLNNSCCADVEIQLEKSVCMELYRDFRELGRFTLRRDGKSIASGTITKLFRDDGVTFD